MSLETEKRTISVMMCIYCKKNHHTPVLCSQCNELLSYAYQRIEHCPFGVDKPACNKCTVHCYSREYREKIREVMRYAGPRMPIRHPYFSLLHILKSK